MLPAAKRHVDTEWRSDSAPPQRRARAQHATRTRHPASAREHATPDPAPCTARPPQHAQHDPAKHNTHCATKHSSTQHTACCTKSKLSHRPPHSRQTPGTDAACAKSHACVGALRLQHQICTPKVRSGPSWAHNTCCTLSHAACWSLVTSRRALPSLPCARHAPAPARAHTSRARTAPAAEPA